jgi:LysM repeat protein
MKFKILLFTVSLLTLSLSLFARPVVDSVGVENHKGKKVVIFKVRAKDTYYSIGRRYHVSPKEIMAYNDKKKETLSIGSTIKIPTDRPFHEEKAAKTKKHSKKRGKAEEEVTTDETEPVSPPQEEVQAQKPVQQNTDNSSNEPQTDPVVQQYKVSAGETLYAISRRFNTTVADITKLNGLTSTTLTPGQILSVRSNAPAPPPVRMAQIPPPVMKRDSTFVAPVPDSVSSEKRIDNPTHFGLFEKNEKGVATWIDDTTLDPNKKLVLHRTAPIGTVIKITNPMTNRTTFAKVVGRFTENEATRDVIIVMTKYVANSLGALDKRFHVNISYGSTNE